MHIRAMGCVLGPGEKREQCSDDALVVVVVHRHGWCADHEAQEDVKQPVA